MKFDKEAFSKNLKGHKRERFHLEHGDNLKVLKSLAGDQFDSLVTDPPAGIAFMGKAWDSDKGGRDEWVKWLSEVLRETYRVMKPGAHGVVWSLPKTSHWTAMAIEDAGFEIIDCVMHIFGSGFPKSQNISKTIDKELGATREVVGFDPVAAKRKEAVGTAAYGDYKGQTGDVTAPATPEAKQWGGWGTLLKPAYEPWWLIRKPISESSIARNVLKHGTGGMNIDASRIEIDFNCGGRESSKNTVQKTSGIDFKGNKAETHETPLYNTAGRFPANVIFDEDAAAVLDEQTGPLKQRGNKNPTKRGGGMFGHSEFEGTTGLLDLSGTDKTSRFFYVAKASKSDKGDENGHPTVKSTKLMEYLITMVTPENGTVLDPFMGSGSTGVAAMRKGFKFFGIDQEKKYTELAKERLYGEFTKKKKEK